MSGYVHVYPAISGICFRFSDPLGSVVVEKRDETVTGWFATNSNGGPLA